MWNFVDDRIKSVGSNDFKKLRRLLMRNDHFRSFTLKAYFSIILPFVKYGIIFNMGFVCNFSSVEQPKKMSTTYPKIRHLAIVKLSTLRDGIRSV